MKKGKESKEIFKPIIYKGKLTHYKISNYGNVINTISNRKLKPVNVNGYKALRLCDKKAGFPKPVNVYVHRLVATAFIDNPNNKPEVNHIDLNRSNNHISNLEWVTTEENYEHARQHGAFLDSVYPIIDDIDVEKIGQMLERGYHKMDIIKAFPKYKESTLRMFFFRPCKKDKKILSKYNIPKFSPLYVKGENNYRATITNKKAKLIIDDMLNGLSNKTLSKKYNVSLSVLSGIRSGDNWKHLTKGIKFPRGLQQDALISKEKVLEVVPYLLKGYLTEEIVKRVKDVKPYHVKRIKLKRIHADILQDYEFPKNPRKVPYEGKLTESEINRVTWALMNGFSFEKISKVFNINIEDIKDLYYHRKYNEFTKGIIFGKHDKDTNLTETMYKYHKNRSYFIKDEPKVTKDIKEKILIAPKIKSKKRKPLIIKFRKTKQRKVLIVKFKKPKKVKSQYEINMELLEREPERKELLDTIIQMIMDGKTNKEIAKELNIKRDFVNHIRVRDNYGWYTKDYEFPDIYKSRYTDQMFKDVADLIMMKYRDNQIMELLPQYNLTRTTICAIRQHRMGRELLKDYDFPVLPRDKKKDKNKLKIKFRINGKVL